MNGEETHALVLFDGVCVFCNSSVNFTIRHDKRDYFRFTPLQSERGQELMKQHGMDPAAPASVMLVENGKLYTKSTAALRIARKLDAGWPLFYGFIIVPRFIRDLVYDLIARNRYKWFGKKDSCMVPTPDVRRKFL